MQNFKVATQSSAVFFLTQAIRKNLSVPYIFSPAGRQEPLFLKRAKQAAILVLGIHQESYPFSIYSRRLLIITAILH